MVFATPRSTPHPGLPSPEDIRQLIKSGKHGQAIQQLQPVLRQNPKLAKANYLMALALAETRRKAEALPFAERAYASDPKTTDHVFLLGRLYVDISLHEMAYPLLKKALAASPRSALIHWAMANYHHQIQKGEAAVNYFRRAAELETDPARKLVIKMELAFCLNDIGEGAEAERLLEEFGQSPGYENLSKLALGFSRKDKPDSKLAMEIRAYLESGTAPTVDQIDGLLVLGRFEENAGNFDKAFALWTQARAKQGVKHHSALKLVESRRLKTGIFSRKLYDASAPYSDQDDRLVFIAGMPRSGTTLTEQILAAHPESVGLGETNRMTALGSDFIRSYAVEYPAVKILENAKRGELRARAKENLAFVAAITEPGWTRAIEKTPFNFEAMGYIHLVHPNARFIHLRRHPADSFISAFQNRFNTRSDYAFDQMAYLERYLAKEEIMVHWKTCFPDRILEVKYEELASNPEPHVRAMLEFIGLPWNDGCMRFFERKTTVRTFSREQVRNSFYTSSVYRWKNYERQLKPMFDEMARLGVTY
jgi:tetratricopeptide (TPR) repeat protein